MAKGKVEDRFCFTWGLGNLGDMGFVPLYRFMLRSYADLGIKRQEMLCIIHLASYHYNSPGGQSRPSLATVAKHMGYAHKQRVWEIIAELEQKGMLIVTRRRGFTSIYNAAPFAKAAYDLWIQAEAQKQQAEGVTTDSNTPTDSVTPSSNTPKDSVTPDSNGGLLQIVTEEEEQEKEGEGEEELILSPAEKEELMVLWSLVLNALKGTMAKGIYNNVYRNSKLVGTENGTWTVAVPAPANLDYMNNKTAKSKTFLGAVHTYAPHVQEIKFIAKEPTL